MPIESRLAFVVPYSTMRSYPPSRSHGATSLTALALFASLTALAAFAAPTGCATAPPCQFNSDCVNAYCSNGVCTKDCVDAERDCPRGYICNLNAQCEPESPTGTGGAGGTGGTGGTTSSQNSSTGQGGAPTTSSTTGMGGAGGMMTTTSQSSSTGQGGATASSSSSSSTTSTGTGGSPPTGNKLLLDLCANDAECSPNLICRPLVRNGPSRCTSTCTSSSTCPSGTRCETVSGTTYCAGEDTGRLCSGAADCNFGCLSGSHYCTVACSTGSDCPAGYGCMNVGSPPQKVCVKAEAYCNAQETADCIGPAYCDETAKMIIGGCTLACNTASDCPRRAAGLPSWTCNGLCRRPSDVNGSLPGGYTPAQYACNAFNQVINLCNDGLHINFDNFTIPANPSVNCNSLNTTDGLPGDACLDSCRYQGGCNYGFACTAVGNIANQRAGLCLPVGFGEVGATCAKHGDCFFGYCSNNKCSRDCTLDGVCPTGSTCVAAGGPNVEGMPFRRCE